MPLSFCSLQRANAIGRVRLEQILELRVLTRKPTARQMNSVSPGKLGERVSASH